VSDESAALALRSSAKLVVIEAPAGSGKTFQAASYARDKAAAAKSGRVLLLAHTHAACDVFAARTRDCAGRIEVRTIDSLVTEIAAAYHAGLGLPATVAAWARRENAAKRKGSEQLAGRVQNLLRRYPFLAESLVARYPVIICDEHQDANEPQHDIVMALHSAGATVRVFGDPMQQVYSRGPAQFAADRLRWQELARSADVTEQLDVPHRWRKASRPILVVGY
jgi:hypothetical protein